MSENYPDVGDLPELTVQEQAALDSIPDDAVKHWWQGEKWINGKWCAQEVSDE